MYNSQTIITSGKSVGLIRFTCWATWVFIIPITLFLLGKVSGLPGFWNAAIVKIDFPLPLGIVGLLLFLLSTIGLWRMQSWGVYLYGLAGLLNVILMAIHAVGTDSLVTMKWSGIVPWIFVAGLHLVYTLKLWNRLPWH